MGFAWTPWVFTILAVCELVVDQLPRTPSRLVPMQFGTRLISGAVSGASVVGTTGSIVGGALVGILGVVIGTFRFHALRMKLAAAFGREVAVLLRPHSSTLLGWRAIPERRSIATPLPTTREKCFCASTVYLGALVGYRPTPAFF